MAKGKFIIMNGEVLESNQPFLKDNRAFRFGDGMFESVRILNGSAYNLKSHIDRMFEGAEVIGIEVPVNFSLDYFKNQIDILIEKNGIDKGGKVRISLFRDGEGTYFSDSDKAAFFIEAYSIEHNLFHLNENGLMTDIFNGLSKESNILSKYKPISSMLPIMAANYAKSKNLDDCLILNQKGRVIESISSNVFIVSNGVLYTPPLEDGSVGGTMRMNVINLAIENGITVYENSLSPQNLLAADEVFLTNAIKGIQWIGGYKNKRYFNKMSKRILEIMNKKEENSVNSMKDLLEN